MEALHLHPMYAWNLAQDFLYSGLIKESHLQSDAKRRIGEGMAAGWINEERRREVRQMLVYSDQIILPPEVDATAFSTALGDAQLEAKRALAPNQSSIWEPSREPHIYRENISALETVMHHPEVGKKEILATLDWWERKNDFEHKHGLDRNISDQSPGAVSALLFQLLRESLISGQHQTSDLWTKLDSEAQLRFIELSKQDPTRESVRFADLSRIVRDAASFSVLAERLARHGYPTFAEAAEVLPSGSQEQLVADYAIVRMYFENVRMAIPESAADAMNLRKNERVMQWRKKIRAWEASLTSGDIDKKCIVDEIDDASGYIEGARGLKSGLAKVPFWFTFSAGALAKFAPALVASTVTGAAIVSGTLLSFGALKLAAAAIEYSVTGKQPLKHDWLMIGPPKN